MKGTAWLDEIDVKCAAVIGAFKELYAHLDVLDEMKDLTENDLKEISAVGMVKLERMLDATQEMAFPVELGEKTDTIQ